MEENTSGVTARILLQGILDAFEGRDWDRLLSLYHPEAVLTTMASGEQPLTPSQVVALLKEVTEDPFYEVTVSTIFDLDPDACLAVGRIRFRNPQGGLTDTERYWLYIFKDDLLWRGSVHRTREATLAAYKAVAELPA
jgi:Domain of unknown function (DUF4440)